MLIYGMLTIPGCFNDSLNVWTNVIQLVAHCLRHRPI